MREAQFRINELIALTGKNHFFPEGSLFLLRSSSPIFTITNYLYSNDWLQLVSNMSHDMWLTGANTVTDLSFKPPQSKM